MNNKKKIVVVTHSAGNGGAERVSCFLANHLLEHDYEVFFYAIHEDKHDFFLNDKIHYYFCDILHKNKFVREFVRAIKLKRFISEHNIDIMVSFVATEVIFTIFNRKIVKICSLRNDPNREQSKGLQKWIRNIVYSNSDAIVFQTEDAKSYFSKKIQNKGIIIPNPVGRNLPNWNRDNNSNTIITACRLSKQKNLFMLIDAMRIVNSNYPEYKLIVYGKGELLGQIKDYIHKCGLDDVISLEGFCNDIFKKMQESSMFVISSDYEGISNSMLEALAIGIPTISTDSPIGGARMFINSGINGFLVRVGDSGEMANRIIDLIKDNGLREIFSNNSRKIRDELDEEIIANKWLDVIESV